MSSTLTKSEVQCVPKSLTSELSPSKRHAPYKEEKREKLVRSSSIEKIKRFNSFICSQHCYILPALLSWLKTSQTILQENIEKSILYVRSLVYSFVVFTKLSMLFSALKTDAASSIYSLKVTDLRPVLDTLAARIYNVLDIVWIGVKPKLFTLMVYLTIFSIFFQFLSCLYFLSSVWLPSGLIFLFVCLYSILHLYFKMLLFYMNNQKKKFNNSRGDNRSAAKPKKFVLGNKTLSNFNLF